MDIAKIGAERRLIFQNYANGVDVEDLKAPFLRSAKEIEDDIIFVARKVQEYRFRRMTAVPKGGQKAEHWDSPGAAPPLAISIISDVRTERLAMLDTLRRIGDETLGTSLVLPKITAQKLDSAKTLREAQAHIARR